MARTSHNLLPFELVIVPSEKAPLHVQLREQLRSAILERRLEPGRRLPSSRVLAQQFSCARGTVLLALEQLQAEGYLQTIGGAGTYVAHDLPEDLLHAPREQRQQAAGSTTVQLSMRASDLLARAECLSVVPAAPPRAFAMGLPALDAFPFREWARLLEAAWHGPADQGAEPAHPFGDIRLRKAIAAYLGSARGFSCDPACVVVTSGVRQALALLADLLLDPGEPVWVEEPGFGGILAALAARGPRPVPVKIDEQGMRLADGMAQAPLARMAVVTPAHQYPLGVTMSLSRRLALLQWAEASGSWIVEDDYDGEYRYAGRPLAPLRALDRSGRVAYVGSFSKVLFPGLRLGYLVMPESLALVGERWLASQGPGTTTLGQAALARFIDEGHFAAHLRRTRRLYAERQAILVEAGKQHWQDLLDIPADPAGMHLVARPAASIASRFDDEEISALAARRGLTVLPLSRHYAGGACMADQGLMLGYAAFSPEAIRGAVRSLADLLSRELAGRTR